VIEVSRVDVEQFLSRFQVQVTDGDGADGSGYDVTMSGADWERLGSAHGTPEAFIEACFRFLLEREPKEQILGSFDVSQIQTYFPDFERAIAKPDSG
jgi:hypothetical protein